MAATGKTPILLYGSTTPTNTPSAGNLTNSSDGCEIAINVADKNLFFKDSTNAVNTVPIRQSSASSNGWLSSTDWSTFNGKAPAFTYTTGYIPFGQGTTTPTQDSSLFWDNTNKRLGLGTASPNEQLTLNSATRSAQLLIGGNVYTYITADNINSASYIGTGSAHPVAIITGATEKARFFYSGGVSIGNTTDPGAANLSVSGNVVIATSGKGIDFSATAGTGTSELLADYEEGTWTPSTSTANLSVTTVSSAYYTKVGRQVTAYCYITVNNTAGGTLGDWTMTGLPFVCNFGFGAATRYYGPNSFSDDCYVNAGTSTVIDVQNLPAGSSAIMMSVTYFT